MTDNLGAEPVHGCTINGQPAMPILISEYNQLVADLAALRAVARGYCPACGRGDAAPTIEDWQRERQRADHAETTLARIAAIAEEHPAGIDTALIHEAPDNSASGATEDPAVDRQTAVVLAALHHSAEADVTRVISLYERWVKAGPPPLGTSISRWWDKRLAELHHAIRPPTREQRERPTHPDGTPYSYAEITAEGWDHCDGCRTWTTATPEHPHQCPQTNMRGPVTGQPQPDPHRHNDGPSIAETREADRRWPLQKHGE